MRGGEKGGGVGRREKLEGKVGGPTSLKGDFLVIAKKRKEGGKFGRTEKRGFSLHNFPSFI